MSTSTPRRHYSAKVAVFPWATVGHRRHLISRHNFRIERVGWLASGEPRHEELEPLVPLSAVVVARLGMRLWRTYRSDAGKSRRREQRPAGRYLERAAPECGLRSRAADATDAQVCGSQRQPEVPAGAVHGELPMRTALIAHAPGAGMCAHRTNEQHSEPASKQHSDRVRIQRLHVSKGYADASNARGEPSPGRSARLKTSGR